MGRLINIDNGGTLTDFCAFDGEQLLFTKTLTTPHDLSACFFDGFGQLARLVYGQEDVARLLQETDYIRYSTTQGTNALVERYGPRLGFITSSDTALALLRTRDVQDALFDTLVGDRARTVDSTLDDKRLDVALTRSINELASAGANRIVVSFNVEHCHAEEQRCERVVSRRYPAHLLGALPVIFAAELSGDPDYTRRTWTTLFNAFLHPAMERFLYSAERRLKHHRTRNPLLIFRNDGGSARVAKTVALKTYSSGPRGGMEGARRLARHYRFSHLLSLDVGGTTTDIGVVEAGEVRPDHHGVVEGVPVSVPLCRINSEGVGGSSIIRVVDHEIRVGPESVGAVPGPACFGRGGRAFTMTDSALLSGLIDSTTYFGGELPLDAARAEAALNEKISKPLGLSPDEALTAAEAAWVARIVAVTGAAAQIDEASVLLGFGGGGPMLLTSVAESLNLKQAILPGLAPVFSAYGIGFSDLSQQYQLYLESPDTETLARARDSLLKRARRDMFAENTALEDCGINVGLVALDGADESTPWAADTPPPTHLQAPLLLRIEVTKPIEQLTLQPVGDEVLQPAETSAMRRLLYRGKRVAVPLYRFRELDIGASGFGPCVVEDDFFTARIDADWYFRLSGNRDVLLTRGAK